MFKHKGINFVILFFLVSAGNVYGENKQSLRIVTSFSILEDLTKTLGGERVDVVNLVARNADAHMYRPKPSDAVAIASADLIIFNGLAFEGWMDRLLANSGEKKTQLIASGGVDVISSDNEVDPHAWQSFKNIRIYVKNIAETLISSMPEYEKEFLVRKQKYLDQLELLERELSDELAKIPADKRIVVTSHDAFGYLGREFDIQFLAPHGVNLEVEASAADVAAVINLIRKQNVTALFVENINDTRLLNRISEETGVGIGGRLYSDALGETDSPANTYLNMMRYNIESLVSALSPSKK